MINAVHSCFRKENTLRCVFCVAMVCAVIAASSMETLVQLIRVPKLQPSGFHLSLFLTALASDTVEPFVAIAAALPFSGTYLDEIKSKFVWFEVFRTSYSTYLLSRLLVCILFGGGIIVLGVLMAYFVCTLMLLPMERASTSEIGQMVELLERCVLLFLNGGVWSVLGMTMSTVMESRYIAYASPFIIHYLLVMLYERYFPNAYLIYPGEWMNPSGKWPIGIWSVAVFLVELIAVLGVIFYCRGKRRLGQL